MRYRQINDLAKEHNPSSIMEIGTWSGDRAIEMMTAGKGLVYFGFDLFEKATHEDDTKEFNVKPHYSAIEVRSRLPFPNKLYQGYSRDTLPVFLKEYGPGKIDFAFIDGGHSLETIEDDYGYVKDIVRPGGVIVFDDYYINAPEDVTDKVGCNTLLKRLDFTLLPDVDPVVQGFGVQIAYVIN